jgi:hypothetical protein
VDGTDDLDETDNDQDITEELTEIAEQDETDHAIREAGGKVIKLQDIQKFDTPALVQYTNFCNRNITRDRFLSEWNRNRD